MLYNLTVSQAIQLPYFSSIEVAIDQFKKKVNLFPHQTCFTVNIKIKKPLENAIHLKFPPTYNGFIYNTWPRHNMWFLPKSEWENLLD